MKRFKAFAAHRRSFELPSRTAPFGDVPTQGRALDTQVPKLKKLSQVVGIESPPPASSPRRDGHHGSAAEAPESNARFWKTPLRMKAPSRGSSFSSSDVQCGSSSSSRLSDASSSLSTATSGNRTNMLDQDGGSLCRRTVVVAFDANARDAVVAAVAWALEHVLRGGDLLVLLGVIDYLRGPLGYKCQVNDHTWLGANAKHLQKELALKKLAWAATPGLQTLCAEKGVKLAVNVKSAARPEVVIVQDAVTCGAVHVVLDRSLKTHTPRKQKFYLEHLRCGVTRMRRSGGAETLRSGNSPTSVPAPTTAAATNATSDDEELFTIDHSVAANAPHHPHRSGHGDGDGDEEEGYESDDLFSIGDVEGGAWRTSSAAGAQLILLREGTESSARNSTVSAFDYDPAIARFVPPRSSVDTGPRLDKRLLSLRLQLRD